MSACRPLVLREVLAVAPDCSERLVTALEFVTGRGLRSEPVEPARLYRAAEKGSSYRSVD